MARYKGPLSDCTMKQDLIVRHLFVVRIVMFVWKDKNKNEKEAGVGAFEKKEAGVL